MAQPDDNTTEVATDEGNKNPNQGQYFPDIMSNAVHQRATYQPDTFGQPVPPDITKEDLEGGFANPVRLSGFSGHYFSELPIVTGGDDIRFPASALYKSVVGNIQMQKWQQQQKQKAIGAFYKDFQDPQAASDYQPRLNKFYQENVMGFMDNQLLPKYGADAYRIAEGDVRNKSEAQDYQDFQNRYMVAESLANGSKDMAKMRTWVASEKAKGNFVPKSTEDMFDGYQHILEHPEMMNAADDMSIFSGIANHVKVLPSLNNSLNTQFKDPDKGTQVVGNTGVPGTYGEVSTNYISEDRVNKAAQQYVNAGYFKNTDEATDYIKNWAQEKFGTQQTMTVKDRPGYVELLKHSLQKQDEGTLVSSPANIYFGKNIYGDSGEVGTPRVAEVQQYTSIKPTALSIGNTQNALDANTGEQISKNFGTDAKAVGIMMMPVTLDNGKLTMYNSSDKKEHFNVPMVQIQVPASVQKLDSQGKPAVDAQGKPLTEKSATDNETYYVPLSQAYGALLNSTTSKEEQKRTASAMDDYLSSADEMIQAHDISKKTRNYYNSTFKANKATSQPLLQTKGFTYGTNTDDDAEQ